MVSCPPHTCYKDQLFWNHRHRVWPPPPHFIKINDNLRVAVRQGSVDFNKLKNLPEFNIYGTILLM